MYTNSANLKKNFNAEGTHSNISSIPSWLFNLIFIETNDAYRNLLRRRTLEKLCQKRKKQNFKEMHSTNPLFKKAPVSSSGIIEGLKTGKGADSVASSPFAPCCFTVNPNSLSKSSKPDENSLKILKSYDLGQTTKTCQRKTNR